MIIESAINVDEDSEDSDDESVKDLHIINASFAKDPEPELGVHEIIEKAQADKNSVIKITWEDVRFTAQVQQAVSKESATCCKSKQTVNLEILKGCSGSALPGQCTYIMGSSGAGKTSLLNVISDRMSNTKGNVITGKILMNGNKVVNQDTFGDIGAYVMQDDILFSYFTVEECLQFAARLKLDTPLNRQKKRVSDLLTQLGLQDVRTSQVGDQNRKIISGGERKRTAIAVELITDPSVLLLDEPTSGLDSFRAYSIIKFLRDLARNEGKTIISTIH